MTLLLRLELILQNLIFIPWTAQNKSLFALTQLSLGESNKQQLLQKARAFFVFLFLRNHQTCFTCEDKCRNTAGRKARPCENHFYLSFLLPTELRRGHEQIWGKRWKISPRLCRGFLTVLEAGWESCLQGGRGSGLEGRGEPRQPGAPELGHLQAPRCSWTGPAARPVTPTLALRGRDRWQLAPAQSYLHEGRLFA